VFALLVLGLLCFLAAGTVSAAEMGVGPRGGSELVDKNNLEGWIIGVDYRGGYFRLLDPRGFQRRVVTKPGTIADYRLGDRVRVQIDPDYKRARWVEKLYS
jgi:hypothetical protein